MTARLRWHAPLLVLWVAVVGLFSYASAPDILPAFSEDTSNALRRSGRIMQALFLVEARAAVEGWDAALLRTAGELWLEAGDVFRALGYLEAAAAASPDDSALGRFLAQQYIELQQWDDAARALERLVERGPDERWAHLQLGLIRAPVDPLTGEAHLRQAMTEPAYVEISVALLDALRRDRGLPVSFEVGLALVDAGQWPYAELAFRHAAALDGTQARALAYTALARGRQGKDGRPWIERAIAASPDDPQIHFLHGLYLRDAGDFTGSVDALVQALALDPENPAYHAELGSAYRLLRDLNHAEYWLRSAVQVSEGDPRFEELLALFYADEAQQLTDEGLHALGLIAGRLQQDADVRAGLGWALVQAGRIEEGQAEIDAALALEPHNPRVLYYAGRVAMETGDVAGAARLLGRLAGMVSPYAGEA
nr:MAG: hypothetical protein DIU68_14835 [Chloroflexota bacterium]